MIRVSAIYLEQEGSHFDFDYYLGSHTAFARRILAPYGLTEIRTLRGIASLDGASPSAPIIAEMVFTDRESFDRGLAAIGGDLFADIQNYTNLTPTLQISELVAD